MKKIWERTFAAFAGPGIDRPSAMMRVEDSEACTILESLEGIAWQEAVWIGAERHSAYRVCNATNVPTTALFDTDTVVGFYCGSYLWINRAHRGLGLSTPLIIAAANQRGGTILPPGVVVQGYTANGIAAHRSAHGHAVLTALAEGLPVPHHVLAELLTDEDKLAVSKSILRTG